MSGEVRQLRSCRPTYIRVHINAEGYGVGGTLTWYGRGGFYLDG